MDKNSLFCMMNNNHDDDHSTELKQNFHNKKTVNFELKNHKDSHPECNGINNNNQSYVSSQSLLNPVNLQKDNRDSTFTTTTTKTPLLHKLDLTFKNEKADQQTITVSSPNNSPAIFEVSSSTFINQNLQQSLRSGHRDDYLNAQKIGAKYFLTQTDQTQKLVMIHDVRAEYHFNPLYTITDKNNDYPNQQNLSLASNPKSDDHFLAKPTDRYGLIYLALLLAGIGFLLPYNAFMIAIDYFQTRFPSTTIVFDMSTTYIVVAFFTVIIQNFFVETISLFWRINFGYFLSFTFMLFVLFYEIWANLGSHVDNLIVISIIAVGCTVQQSTFYGYTSMLPKRYTHAVMTGESAAGVLVSFNRIFTKIVYPHDKQFNTILFFSISIIIIFFCAVIHIVLLPRSEFIRHHILLCKQKLNDGARIMHRINENVSLVNMYHNNVENGDVRPNQINEKMWLDPRPSILSNESDTLENMNQNILNSSKNIHHQVERMLRTDSTESVLPFGIDDEEIALENVVPPTSSLASSDLINKTNDYSLDIKTKKTPSFWLRFLNSFEALTHSYYFFQRIFYRLRKLDKNFSRFHSIIHRKLHLRKKVVIIIWPFIVSIMMVYFVTLTIFPGIESEIYSCEFGEWLPIFVMATFNLTDFIGKLITSLSLKLTSKQMITMSFLRVFLIPLFALTISPRTDPFFKNFFWSILFSAILGLTNGIFGSLPMILAPAKVNEQMREITGNVMTFSYIIGLTTGSFASYVLNDWTNQNVTFQEFISICDSNNTLSLYHSTVAPIPVVTLLQ